MRDKNIFNEQKEKNGNGLKYFIIAFSVFVVILAAVSAFLLMKSIDFDLNNIGGKASTDISTTGEETTVGTYSVSELSGKSDILLISLNDENELNYLSVISTDFDNKSMQVKMINQSSTAAYNSKTMSFTDIYNNHSVDGVMSAINNSFCTQITKYIKFTPTQLKNFLSLFNDITVNVSNDVDYRSENFNLELDAGEQALSADYIYRYFSISDDYQKSLIICDIINSVLTPEYSKKSEKLFEDFTNSVKTNITIWDYSESAKKLETYSNSTDKFLPQIGELK